METKEKNLEEYSHPEGVEVKVSAARANITILLNLFFFVVGGVILFNYIWGDGSSYGFIYKRYNYYGSLLYSIYLASIWSAVLVYRKRSPGAPLEHGLEDIRISGEETATFEILPDSVADSVCSNWFTSFYTWSLYRK